MIMPDLAAYVATAIRLGNNPAEAKALKEKLLSARATSTLFNTNLLVSSLEGLFERMWQDFAAGNLPVPDLRNLEIYEEVAVTHQAAHGPVNAPDYTEALAAWNAFYPLALDSRLWTGETPASSDRHVAAIDASTGQVVPLQKKLRIA